MTATNASVKRNKKAEKACPVRDVLSRIGSRWSLLILKELESNGALRFNVLRTRIGDISQRMLSQTLRDLASDGLVRRKAFMEVPPHVEYSLTPMGASLMPTLQHLMQWASENYSKILASRRAHAARK